MSASWSKPESDDGLIYNNTSLASESSCSASNESASRSCPDNAVAVIGLACKFAGADSIEQFWDILETGTSQARDLPSDRFPDWRFDRRSYPKNFKANTMDDVDAFDHKFFKITSREATFMDPQQRLALQVTYQALESAGYFSHSPRERELDIGYYVATCTNEYHENVACHAPSAFSLTGSIRPFIAGKVSHHFGWTGPAIMLDTACAASGTAIHQACRAIVANECKGAVVGATNIFVSPDTFQNLAAGHFISPTGGSKSFDAAADGYCRGEGVAFVVLKKLSAALKDGDPIKGVIASSAIGQNANETSITIPHGPSQASLYRKALQIAGLNAQDVSYVEAHGTGTPVGDPIEALSIRSVFGDSERRRTFEKTYLGSLKSNIGHTEATSGISGLIKVLMMMQKSTIPQQALFKKLNPSIAPLEPDGIEIPKSNISWASKFKAACVNNYGASGSNAVMIVTQPPDVTTSVSRILPTACPVSITAFSPSSLASYCSVLLEFISKSTSDDLLDIVYHLSRRKNLDLSYSVCTTVSSLQDLKTLLKSTIVRQPQISKNVLRPVVMFFGGQSGRTADVPRSFYDSCAVFRKHLDNCHKVLERLGVPSIFPAIFESEPQSDIVLLHSMLFSRQYASAMAWLDCGLRPSRLIGHSFGQLTALCVSGTLSLQDGLRLVVERARLVERAWGKDPGSMVAIEGDLDALRNLLTQQANLDLEIACYNGPQSFVIAGSTASVDALEIVLNYSPDSFQWRRLKVTNAFHSPLAEPLVGPLRAVAQHLNFCEATIPVEICSGDGDRQLVTPDLIASHIREPVDFYQAVERTSDQLGPCIWVEAGMGSGASVLRRALGTQASFHNIISTNLNSTSSIEPLAKLTSELWSSGIEVQFWPFHQMQQRQYKQLNLPPYQFDKSRHWLDWKDLSQTTVKSNSLSVLETSLLHLVQKTKGRGEFRINTRCETWQKICSEYRVLGISVCPVSLSLKLTSEAIDIITHTATRGGQSYNISQLEMRKMVSANSDTELYLTTTETENSKSWQFEISGAPDSSDVYLCGIVSKIDRSTPNDFARFQRLIDVNRIKDISNDAEADSVKGKTVYKTFGRLFQFPVAAQNIKEVSSKDNEAIGYLISRTDEWFTAIEGLLQIPLLYTNGLRDHENHNVHIVTSVGQAKLNCVTDMSSDKSVSWAVYTKFFESDDQALTCDIFAFDVQSGKLSAVILDVTLTQVRHDSLRRTLNGVSIPLQLSTNHYVDPPQDFDFDCIEHHASQVAESELSLRPVHVHSTTEPGIRKSLFELLSHVADVDLDLLRVESSIIDLGIDSLMAMDVTEEINKLFSTKIDAAEVLTCASLSSLCELIAGKTTDIPCVLGTVTEASSDTLVLTESDVEISESDVSDVFDAESVSDTGFSESTSCSCLHRCSVDKSSSFVLEAFKIVRGDFDLLARKTGCDNFWAKVYPVQTDLIVSYIVEAFARLECDLRLIQAGEKIPTVLHSSGHPMLIMQLMRILQDHGFITQVADVWIRTSKPVSPSPSSSEKYEWLLAEFPQFAPDHKLLHIIGSKLFECLSGKVKPLALLFGNSENRRIMADQYLNAPIQSSTSQQLCSFISNHFSSRAIDQPLRVLEIGGGTCGTSLHVAEAFAQLPVSVDYTFTDVSPSFVSAAKSKLARYNFIKYKALDITNEPGPDMRDHYDMIIATNVLHATPDVCKSAENARKMLRPGGFLTLVEYTRRLHSLDVVFGQLDGWWAFEDGRDHAIMDENEWKTTLQCAGFKDVDWTSGRSRESEILKIILAC